MGKKVEKSLSKERHSTTIPNAEETDPNKPHEPYKCYGNFLMDFNELCKQNQMTFIPSVLTRSKLPGLNPVSSDSKLDKKGDKKQQQQAPIPEVEPEVELNEGEGPPKTYTIRDKFQYFKPNVQVELDNTDKWDTVTEVYVRGWKIDVPMMEIFHQSWISLSKLHTINLWNVGLTGETLHALATFLPQCSNVKNVVLDGNSVKEENWSELIGENSLIQNLSLRYCNITDKGAAGFGKVLGSATSSNTKLLSLNLAGNLIGDSGAEQLAESLRMNCTLLSLILTSNNIGDRGANKISETLSRFALTHEEVVVRRMLMSEKEASTDRKSPLPSRRGESKERPGSVSRSVTSQDKSKPKPSAKKKDVKSKDSKDDTKPLKRDKEDTKGASKKESRASRGAPANQNTATGHMSSASSSTDVTKSQSKTKDKKKERGRTASSEHDLNDALNSDNQDHINPLLEPADYIGGELWIAGNRTLINLNLSRNKIGEPGMASLLKAMQYQKSLTFDSKSGGPGLLRLVVTKNDISPEMETVVKLVELMVSRDPFLKSTVSETSTI